MNSTPVSPSTLMKAAVIGYPILHSLSPFIFRMISALEKTNLEYARCEVKEPDLNILIAALRKNSAFLGMNVTLPHKEKVIPLLDSLTEEARAIGAVNVIHRANGKLLGFNTDVFGIAKTFLSAQFQAKDQTCFIFGAGGSAKAVAHVLGSEGAKTVWVYNPRSSRASDFIENFSKQFPQTRFLEVEAQTDLSEEIFSLVVNTTPVGMFSAHPKPEGYDAIFEKMAELRFTSSALAFDLIYTPEDTPFLKRAADLGLKTKSGLGMLVDQALATWEIWTGQKETARLHDPLVRYLRGVLQQKRDRRPIFLTGFMGVGKTTLAQECAALTGRDFVDSDEHIVKEAGLSIPEIFAKHGEGEFRRLEKEIIEKLVTLENAVIALGGGTLLNPEVLKLVKASGVVVFLEADESTLENRITAQGFNRPLLQNLDEIERRHKISTLLRERSPIYGQAHLRLSTVGASPSELVDEMISRIGELST